MKSFYKVNYCRICRSKNLKKIIDLKAQYIQGSFVKKNNPKPYLKKIPLNKFIFMRNKNHIYIYFFLDEI